MCIKRASFLFLTVAISACVFFVSLGAGPMNEKPTANQAKAIVKDLSIPDDSIHDGLGKKIYQALTPVETVDGRLIPQVNRDPLGVYPKCLTCHVNIENVTEAMGFDLDCTFCHGGNPDALDKLSAHVQPTLPVIMDNTVAPLDYDLPYQQFVNPSNLRVVENTCGACHPFKVERIFKSMMATAAGHYAGGLYQNAVQNTKTPIYGTFAVEDVDGIVPIEKGAVQSLVDLIEYDPSGDPSLVSTHFAAVPAQACARCHLWSRGKGYRGAMGAEGVYRADGCAACHMIYDDIGLSQSADMSINHFEQGHPRVHEITKQIPTMQCVHCHHRGARIGLNYTGRAQMPPRLPSGPGIVGTTDIRFNGNYHYTQEDTNPMDVHFARGMDCIDCHTSQGIMGDGNIYGHMDQATKIECRMCHGLPNQLPTLTDHDGLLLNNTFFEGEVAKLTGKVTGAVHIIPLVRDIVDPKSPKFNANAACAMNGNHLKDEGGLECYACHSAWTANCFGCHFERDERYTGVNLVTRNEEVGRVKTNNKVFETFRPFFIGPNSEGRVAPYVVACQPIADVTAPDGSKILDFKMPVTSKGKSGLAINPVQPHTIQGPGNVRTCAECHRAPASLGMGTGNYSLARNYAFVVADDGIRVFDRKTDPASPAYVTTLHVVDPLAMVTKPDIVEGTANAVYVAAGTDGVVGFSLTNTIFTGGTNIISGINAIDIARVAKYFYVVDEGFGIRVYDSMEGPRLIRPVPATTPPVLSPIGLEFPRLVSTIEIPNAQRVLIWGIHLFVAAGNDGLFIINIGDQKNPVIEAVVPGINAQDIHVYTHYQQGQSFAIRGYIADPDVGIHVIDLLPNIGSPTSLWTIPLTGAIDLDTYTAWIPGNESRPSREHDFLYVAAGVSGLHIFDITDPDIIFEVAAVTNLGGSVDRVDVTSQMSPPGVDDYAFLANPTAGLQVVDVTDPLNPIVNGSFAAPGARGVFVEVQQMDRFLNEEGNILKENSHPFTSNFNRQDIVRILSSVIDDCGSQGALNIDLNNDGLVNYFDVSIMIRAFGTNNPTADLDKSGVVDLDDFMLFLQAM